MGDQKHHRNSNMKVASIQLALQKAATLSTLPNLTKKGLFIFFDGTNTLLKADCMSGLVIRMHPIPSRSDAENWRFS